jgi:hypothetical protein
MAPVSSPAADPFLLDAEDLQALASAPRVPSELVTAVLTDARAMLR